MTGQAQFAAGAQGSADHEHLLAGRGSALLFMNIVTGRALHLAARQHALGDRLAAEQGHHRRNGIVEEPIGRGQRRVKRERNRMIVAQIGRKPRIARYVDASVRGGPEVVDRDRAVMAAQAGLRNLARLPDRGRIHRGAGVG